MNVFIDTFTNAGGFSILHIEGKKDISKLQLPLSLEIEKEVTEDKDYSSYQLAKLYKSKARKSDSKKL